MKRLLISLLGALVFSAAVQAAEPQSTTSAANDAPAAEKPESKQTPVSDAYCLRHTGTRITNRASRADAGTAGRKARTCNNGMMGRAYTREDLDRTGETNIADALRRLDPAIH